MLKLTKNTTNEDLILYLTELTSISSPVFLFVFKKGNNLYPVISQDLSDSPNSYNKFTIVEGGNDPENGEVLLGGAGEYELLVYEQSSTTNLDPDNATLILQTLARVTEDYSGLYVAHEIDLTYTEHQIL